MPLEIIRNDITKMRVDAIVNATNERLQASGGVDAAIHRKAGPELEEACRRLKGCKPGAAKVTGGYGLPAKYVIHTVGPVWHGGLFGEKKRLESCYRTSLELAKAHGCKSVAFPLISSGVYGYPKDKALRVAMDTITEFLMENDMLVYLVLFDQSAFQISSKLFTSIQSYIDDHYVQRHEERFRQLQIREELECAMCRPEPEPETAREICDNRPAPAPRPASVYMSCPSQTMSLNEVLNQIDESFSEMLLRKIDEKGMKDSACYKKANINRKLFSKIRSDRLYKPSKPTVLAFAIALELSLEETREMLQKAGFALSHSNKFDIIVEYFIQNEIYDIFQINEALFSFDQSLLGT